MSDIQRNIQDFGRWVYDYFWYVGYSGHVDRLNSLLFITMHICLVIIVVLVGVECWLVLGMILYDR